VVNVPLVAVTRLHIRRWYFLFPFILAARRSEKQARSSAGNLAVSLMKDAGATFWTCTLWNDEAAMKAYMLASPHREAMPKLLDWCDEASVVHWTQDHADLPAWTEAHRRMQAEGRISKVRNPSEAHTAFRFPPPRG
jgi:heme-degrading monooxygenase HmoA